MTTVFWGRLAQSITSEAKKLGTGDKAQAKEQCNGSQNQAQAAVALFLFGCEGHVFPLD
jgi:hypothetical protein